VGFLLCGLAGFGKVEMQIQLTPSLVLTDERTESRYGIPVLVNRQDDATAYGPADIIDVYHKVQPAAHVVHRFAKRLTGDEREAAANFLRQWPDGPQLS
jgi:hypothetical protein